MSQYELISLEEKGVYHRMGSKYLWDNVRVGAGKVVETCHRAIG